MTSSLRSLAKGTILFARFFVCTEAPHAPLQPPGPPRRAGAGPGEHPPLLRGRLRRRRHQRRDRRAPDARRRARAAPRLASRPTGHGRATRPAGAALYCPSYEHVDADLVRRAHAGGVAVVPWTVNDPEHWGRLLAWGVDGITTDYPDRLAAFLRRRAAG